MPPISDGIAVLDVSGNVLLAVDVTVSADDHAEPQFTDTLPDNPLTFLPLVAMAEFASVEWSLLDDAESGGYFVWRLVSSNADDHNAQLMAARARILTRTLSQWLRLLRVQELRRSDWLTATVAPLCRLLLTSHRTTMPAFMLHATEMLHVSPDVAAMCRDAIAAVVRPMTMQPRRRVLHVLLTVGTRLLAHYPARCGSRWLESTTAVPFHIVWLVSAHLSDSAGSGGVVIECIAGERGSRDDDNNSDDVGEMFLYGRRGGPLAVVVLFAGDDETVNNNSDADETRDDEDEDEWLADVRRQGDFIFDQLLSGRNNNNNNSPPDTDMALAAKSPTLDSRRSVPRLDQLEPYLLCKQQTHLSALPFISAFPGLCHFVVLHNGRCHAPLFDVWPDTGDSGDDGADDQNLFTRRRMEQTVKDFMLTVSGLHIGTTFHAMRIKSPPHSQNSHGGLWCLYEQVRLAESQSQSERPATTPTAGSFGTRLMFQQQQQQRQRSLDAQPATQLWTFWIERVPMKQLRLWNVKLARRVLALAE